eukprot:15444818-Alexandrium_andersonii.AAC.1
MARWQSESTACRPETYGAKNAPSVHQRWSASMMWTGAAERQRLATCIHLQGAVYRRTRLASGARTAARRNSALSQLRA